MAPGRINPPPGQLQSRPLSCSSPPESPFKDVFHPSIPEKLNPFLIHLGDLLNEVLRAIAIARYNR